MATEASMNNNNQGASTIENRDDISIQKVLYILLFFLSLCANTCMYIFFCALLIFSLQVLYIFCYIINMPIHDHLDFIQEMRIWIYVLVKVENCPEENKNWDSKLFDPKISILFQDSFDFSWNLYTIVEWQLFWKYF